MFVNEKAVGESQRMLAFALADYIEKSDDYSYGSYQTCICGMLGRMMGRPITTPMNLDCSTLDACVALSSSIQAQAEELGAALGLTEEQIPDLFNNSLGLIYDDKRHAARVVRNFGATGKVNWYV